MKRTTSSRRKKVARGRNTRSPRVNSEDVTVLRTVGDQEAFHFYEAIGKPTGEVARNLPDFLDKVKSVKSESLLFHLQRKDFQNWVEKTLGDSKLATDLEQVSLSDGEDIRSKIHEVVENRVRELRESAAIVVNEDSAILLPLS